MGFIKLENICVYAYHGCLEEETKIGSDYSVDIMVETNFIKSSVTDSLSDALDYVLLNTIVVEEMSISSKLLETVANRIVNRVLNESDVAKTVRVWVSKLNPPVGGNVEKVTVSISKKRKKL